MERSEPSDAWDDAGDDPRDDAFYGPAPLPAHERAWRHPSEMGQRAWVLTEPPIAIGRGLLVTTGAIGCVLGVAVLWLLVPIGGGLAPTASPTVTSSIDGVRGVITSTTQTPDRTDLVNDTIELQPSQITLPSEDVPLNTVLVTRPRTPEANAVAVAVSFGDTPFIVTTANAVSDTGGFSMVGTGDPSNGSIVAIDGKLAYLASNDDLDIVGFAQTGFAQDGDMVTVLGQEQTPVHFGSGAVPELDATVVREGTPVIDESGALVALCTLVQGVDGSYVALVPIGTPPPDPSTSTVPGTPTTSVVDSSTSTTAPPTSTSTSTTTTVAAPLAWVGISFGDVDPATVPVITKVVVDSPAALAGLVAGDQIVAVDGDTVSRIDEVFAAIKAKVPGDTIVFTVVTTSPAPASTSTSTSSSTSSTTTTTTTAVGATPTTKPVSSTSIEPAPVERTISVVLGVYEPAV